MMAKSMNALFTGRIQKRKTNPLHHSHLACNTRLRDRAEPAASPVDVRCSAESRSKFKAFATPARAVAG
jgi:hypothetical protein